MSDSNRKTAGKLLQSLMAEWQKAIVGKPETLRLVMISLLCRGHLLLEDLPGLGKTTLAKTLAKSLDLGFKRIQCTPDLLPADITGISMFDQKAQAFRFLPGPVFTNILLADEINRTSPRTQSALLEAMAERTVTVDRKTRDLPATFMVIATQNPIEFSGTFPLPEAQLDRFFMRVSLGYPKQEAETRMHKKIRLGVSPRGLISLMKASQASALLNDESFVTPRRVQELVAPVLAHRMLLRSNNDKDHTVLQEIIDATPVPAMPDGKGERQKTETVLELTE